MVDCSDQSLSTSITSIARAVQVTQVATLFSYDHCLPGLLGCNAIRCSGKLKPVNVCRAANKAPAYGIVSHATVILNFVPRKLVPEIGQIPGEHPE